ncbi:MAG: hypothetical protein C0404_08185 [Verrucomicrobia bacterium]|nr:hypothetical protein [Verrucomicrobiota bacterium]
MPIVPAKPSQQPHDSSTGISIWNSGTQEKEKNAACGSDRGSASLLFVYSLELALTRNGLSSADRTHFNIASGTMEFTFGGAAIVTTVVVCLPLVSFLTIANAGIFLASHDVDRPSLFFCELFLILDTSAFPFSRLGQDD